MQKGILALLSYIHLLSSLNGPEAAHWDSRTAAAKLCSLPSSLMDQKMSLP